VPTTGSPIRGDPDTGRAADRVNHGRLDPKDVYGWQANSSPGRLRVRRGRVFWHACRVPMVGTEAMMSNTDELADKAEEADVKQAGEHVKDAGRDALNDKNR
jgi:hypothetical protein